MKSDVSLDELLAVEIDKRLGAAGTVVDPDTLRVLLHSLRGSVAMTGHLDLALLVGQLAARCRQQEDGAADLAIAILRAAALRLRAGLPPLDTSWPVPPTGLVPSVVDANHRSEYRATMLDRLTELDSVITLQEPSQEGLEHAYRIVHSMKGTAGAVGDDTTAWYCHGLESKLRAALQDSPEWLEALTELARHSGTIARLVDEPHEAFAMLRALKKSVPLRSMTPVQIARVTAHPSSRPVSASWVDELEGDTQVAIRVPNATFERIFDHLEHVELSFEELHGISESVGVLARTLRDVSHELLEVHRLGITAVDGTAASTFAYRLEELARRVQLEETQALRVAQHCKKNAESLRLEWYETRAALSHLRRTKLAWLFERLVQAAQRFADGEGKLVRVDTIGGDVSIDRGIADRLLEAVMQVVRNAVSHGIAKPSVRVAAGKSPYGLLVMTAVRHGDWLRLVIEDDGSGVDVLRVRQLAVERGVVTEEMARHLGEHELFNLLFLPGLTTRSGVDVLAGRGVGLDLAQDIMRRLGGAMRLSSRKGGGVKATLEFPIERGLIDVVWLTSGQFQFALPVTFTGRVKPFDPKSQTLSLSACVGVAEQAPSAMELEICVPGVQAVAVGIDTLGEVEEVVVRPLPALLAERGPYAGAVLRGDGTLRVVLDAAIVTAQLWSRLG